MRTRRYGIRNCPNRYDETRDGIGKGKSGMKEPKTLKDRCVLRGYSKSNKKCLFPNKTLKDCPIVR